MKHIAINVLILLGFVCISIKAEYSETTHFMIQHPELYIKITDWSFYAAWGMSTIRNVAIENTSDVAYKEIKVRVSYYLSYYPTEPNTAIVILPVTLAPHSNKTYLEKGVPSLIVNAGGM